MREEREKNEEGGRGEFVKTSKYNISQRAREKNYPLIKVNWLFTKKSRSNFQIQIGNDIF